MPRSGNENGSIDAGITRVIRKLRGREQSLIPILMILFAIGGSTYGIAAGDVY
ncbi:hypothetical protein [Bacillus sp. WMMC1349]|uniref:hypothetical protein n=1 Tax=Bacillus sp. WMMC1349 TaxID=2736254 RepID=UPI0035C8C3C7